MPYLTQAADIQVLINQIASAKTLWLDTEVADWHTPNPRLSLIQVLADSYDLTGDAAYILDVLDKPDLVVDFVNQIMANPNIEKVFHNANFDLKFLGKEKAQNVTCTFEMVKKLTKKSHPNPLQVSNKQLKTLAVELCQFSNIDKEEQQSDWGRRPLTEKQIKYAKMDTVYLAQVHLRLLEIIQPDIVSKIFDTAASDSKQPTQKSEPTSFSVTKVRVAFECPRLFYLGHRLGGKMMFLPPGNPPKIGIQFHQLADHFAFIAKQEPKFQALFEPEAEQLNVEAIAQQLQQLFYELSFFPHLQAAIKTDPGKAPALFQVWEGLKGLIRRWAELLIRNRRYCSASDVINKTLIALKPTVKHHFQLPDGTQQLVQGRFDSVVYDFENHRLCVVEYKTYQSPDKSAQLAQAALYSYMLREKLGVPIDSAVYSVLPNWDEISFTWDELKNTVHQLIPQKLQQMRQWIDWEPPQPNPPSPTPHPDLLCDICPQRKKCQTYFVVADADGESTPIPSSVTPQVSLQLNASDGVEPPQPQVGPHKVTSQKQEKEATPDADEIAKHLVETLQSFKLDVDYLGAAVGPAFIRVKLKPNLGVKVNSLLKLSADLQVQLGIANPPLIAPQAGYVSVDLPRPDRQVARFEDYIQPKTTPPDAPVRIAIGVDLDGKLIEADLSDPNTCHFLVGGTTGSGKSEFLRSLLLSLLYRHSPQQLKIALVDPKRVTFPEFERMPWLLSPVVKDSEDAIALMEELVSDMEQRYRWFEAAKCPHLDAYNQQLIQRQKPPIPRTVCIFDEYADFMAEKEVRSALELSIKRLGAMARAAGIHLIIATQRPEAGVVTPIIRSNLPGRVALRTASEADSAIILGGKQTEAAYLLGKGDLLYLVSAQLQRLQSLYAAKIHLPG
ncbi:MAG: PD-(D/E)XK nuclease family protein [Coleofasciculus sp. S288]|nr:PD-(D/E)XK nuclease family protein [Coleofasciculus sp. S288]